MNILEKIFGSHSQREVKRIMPLVEEINSLEPEMQALSDKELQGKTKAFKERLKNGETLEDILPEAFAAVREAGYRVLGMRHFDVQLIGGIIMHQGRIAEMKTGEGKTLVATLPIYLNALTGNGVHLVTVNDYLAKRDSEWMGKLYTFMGLSVGLIIHDMDNDKRREAYACDITYGTNNEYGFDYLRDNMVTYKEEMVQRPLHYAIVDEVDSILIDEARTPLIISGEGDKSTDLYEKADRLAKNLKVKIFTEQDDKQNQDTGDAEYVIDEKASTAVLTELGVKRAENYFNVENLSDAENITLSHHINQAIRANGIMKKDKDYVVKDGEIIIVDEFTGRMMFGRRYSDGLHQAIEAKEGVKVERESKTLATITFQNYFRMYGKLSGMTGTALTEEEEFREIYKLDVITIPTNMPVCRTDKEDAVYLNEKAKFRAVVEEIAEANKNGQPVLVGTISIEKSEQLSGMLKRRGIRHEVLNAKHHAREAEIVAQAGKFGAVTIATNMAGRGTDIVLGGNAEYMAKQELRKKGIRDELIIEADSHNDTDNEEIQQVRKMFSQLEAEFKNTIKTEREEVIKAGGLYIIGTERHESRRIDNQLRGRSGRQGDPGASKFYISLEDDLMRLFGSERIQAIVSRLNIGEDEPIEARILSGRIESAQKKVESRNFSVRKHVIQYDDVMNQQRELIYKQRRQVLDGENIRDNFMKMIESVVDRGVVTYTGESEIVDNWDFRGMSRFIKNSFGLKGTVDYTAEEMERINKVDVREDIIEAAVKKYEEKESELGEEVIRDLERMVLLHTVDEKWMDHIDAMEQLKSGIGLRGYGQRDPVIEYRFEGFDMFEEMIRNIQSDAIAMIFNVRVNMAEEKPIRRRKVAAPVSEGFAADEGEDEKPVKKVIAKSVKVGRNEPCPCGSGKKYKNCCGNK